MFESRTTSIIEHKYTPSLLTMGFFLREYTAERQSWRLFRLIRLSFLTRNHLDRLRA